MTDTVFIAYGREDAASAQRLQKDLAKVGYKVWLDRESLVAGQNWRQTIGEAIRSARYFIALLSSRSINRRGFLNKEIAEALQILEEFPKSAVFLVPARLDDCQMPDSRLEEIQCVNLFPSWEEGLHQLQKAFSWQKESIPESEDENRKRRAYVLGRLPNGDFSALRRLAKVPGVLSVEPLSGPSDFILVLEAPRLSDSLNKIFSISGWMSQLTIYNVLAPGQLADASESARQRDKQEAAIRKEKEKQEEAIFRSSLG